MSEISYGIGGKIDRTITNGIYTLSLPNIKIDGTLDVLHEEVPQTIVTEYKKKNILLKKADLLFNWRNGSAAHLGKTAYFNLEGEYSHVSFLLKIRFDLFRTDSRYFCIGSIPGCAFITVCNHVAF